MPSGILIVHKPTDWTSMDVCAKLRGIFHEKRVGHAGTLDPMATGVLPVFLGRATRAVQFAETGSKEYLAGLCLGLETNTQDTSGTVLVQKPVHITREELEKALEQFRGEIQQVPPMYSAVKINGKKLYELARKGVEVERKARTVTIHSLELVDRAEGEALSQSFGPEGGELPRIDYYLRIQCSKGTYIRTLCHDLGQVLGCGACMGSLTRTEACGFPLSEAVSLEEIQAAEDSAALLRPVDALFAHLPQLRVNGKGEERIRHGAELTCGEKPEGEYRVYGPEGTFLALSQVKAGRLTTVKSFFEP